jgi:hypothetical protein
MGRICRVFIISKSGETSHSGLIKTDECLISGLSSSKSVSDSGWGSPASLSDSDSESLSFVHYIGACLVF